MCSRPSCLIVWTVSPPHLSCAVTLLSVNITPLLISASGSSLAKPWHYEPARSRTQQNESQDLAHANSQERLARQRVLGALRQQEREVRAFAQFFWTMSRGLDYQDAALKDIFNLCLDNPLPQWEMEQLRILDFWDFSNYVHHRKDWQILSPPESTCTD